MARKFGKARQCNLRRHTQPRLAQSYAVEEYLEYLQATGQEAPAELEIIDPTKPDKEAKPLEQIHPSRHFD